jgi:hypothetical protein
MSWNYRILHFETDIGDYYSLHEVYYHEGIPFARTERDFAYGETPEELIEQLEMMLKDAKKHPIMKPGDINEKLGNEILGSNISTDDGDN